DYYCASYAGTNTFIF
nr:immunoglobulin light chain junction region [Macaca mulatta]